MWNGSAGPWPLISFGSEICGDPRLAAEREWLVTNGLGGYAMGTVSGAPSRSYHGLLIAALSPPVERTLLVSRLQESLGGEVGASGCGRGTGRRSCCAATGDAEAPTNFLQDCGKPESGQLERTPS